MNFTKSKISKKIIEVIESPAFKERLKWINLNYPNLKQEMQIRNTILEEVNKDFFSGKFEYRAFAEFQHPENSHQRVDLTFVDRNCTENKFYVELKFQFSNDDLRFKKYRPVIEKDFEVRNSDSFILIVAHWDKDDKTEFDKTWGVTPNLNQYISKTDCWKENIPNLFKSFTGSHWEMIPHSTESPYVVDYQFYILTRDYKEILEVNDEMIKKIK